MSSSPASSVFKRWKCICRQNLCPQILYISIKAARSSGVSLTALRWLITPQTTVNRSTSFSNGSTSFGHDGSTDFSNCSGSASWMYYNSIDFNSKFIATKRADFFFFFDNKESWFIKLKNLNWIKFKRFFMFFCNFYVVSRYS